MDGELRSENLYLASMPEQRSVVAAVVVALYLQIETALEGVVVRKLHENHNDDTMEVQGLVTFSAKIAFSWPSVDRFGKILGGLMTLNF